MAFFGTVTLALRSKAAEATTAEGVDVYEFKSQTLTDPTILCLLMVDKKTENAQFLKALSEQITDTYTPRVLATGVVQLEVAQKDKKDIITKPPKMILYVNAVRRIRDTQAKDPEQVTIMGSGFTQFQTERNNDEKRKPEVILSATTESLKEEGAYSSRLRVVSDKEGNTEELFKTVDNNTEIYFVGTLFRSMGNYMEKDYDNLKVSASFALKTDRVKDSGGYSRKPKASSMRSQLDSSFEEDDKEETSISADELASRALASLDDF